MAGKQSGFRNRIFRALHAEAIKKKIDHDALHDIFATSYGLHSMSEASDAQLLGLYRQWTGKTLRRKSELPERNWEEKPDAIVSGEELVELAQEFAKRGLSGTGRDNFVRRQLKGRGEVRSRRDFIRVLRPLRLMNERDGLR